MSVFKMNLFGLRLRKTQAFQSEIQITRFNKVSDSVREAGAHRTYLGPVTLETKKKLKLFDWSGNYRNYKN